jgi:arylsulfatase/arylsulfatase A
MMTQSPLRPDAAQRPNVVLIIMDDLGWGDLSCHGNPHTHTDRLDAMHAQSVRCVRTCSGPVCTPARAALMTGRDPYRTRAIDTYCGRSTLDPDERTLAQVLKQAGYTTCLSGKWHLGDNYPSRPMDMGFDEQLMHNGGGLRQPANPGYWKGQDAYHDPLLSHNGQIEKRSGYCTDIFTDHAIGFIEEHHREPFFVYLATNAPHTPLEIDERWYQPFLGAGLPETFARLYGMVQNIDQNVGRVLDRLDQLGLSEDTIVIYTSDHGPCGSAQHEGRNRFNAGLRDKKGTPYEGGVRVPLFWRWPKRFGTQGRDMDRLCGPQDVLPTLAAACGAQMPTDRAIDGINLLPVLEGSVSTQDWPDRYFALQWHRGDAPIPYRNCLMQNQRYKLVNGRELYDLAEDPGEQCDVAAEHPERVAELRQAYERWLADVSSTRPENYAPVPIPLGTPHESPTTLNRNDRRAHDRDAWIEDWPFGHWEVRFTKPAGRSYRVELELPPMETAASLCLVFGESVLTRRIEPNAQAVTFDALSALPGRGRIQAWLTGEDGERRSARYVHVS